MKSRPTLAILVALLVSAVPPLSRLAAAAPGAPGQLLNISTRLPVQTGDNALIGGFIVTGNAPKKVIIRGLGPSLAAFFDGALQDPTLQLFQGNTLLASNDNWRENEAEVQATGIPPTNDLESAIVRTLAPGAYTAVLRGKGDTTGIALVEAYDLDQAADSKLANISTRGFIDTGNNVMIGGVIVGPSDAGSTYVIVRAIGPSLASANISNPLQDPTLDLVDQNGATVRSNDNWKDSQAADIEGTGLQPADPRESTLIAPLQPGVYTAIVRGVGNTTGVGVVEVYEVGGSLPAPLPVLDPISQAPPPPVSGIPSFDDEIGFLYKGRNPIQRGVAPGTIVPTAAAVIRGLVKNLADEPLVAVRVTVHGHPEYGYTLSRADGQYDLAVNGGLTEHLTYELTGYFPAQREVQVLQQAFSKAPDVLLITADPVATTVAFGAASATQMAGSSTRADGAGSRSATMYFPAGTSAQLVFGNGTVQSVDHLTFRPTEYTVGPKGPAAMPAPLPGASQYTYCVEMAAEEVMSSGAKAILFDHTVYGYVENFLGFPVGAVIPNGYYDYDKAAWVPSANGLVLKLLSVSNGVAQLDANGDGTADSDEALAAIGLDLAERQQLATRFAVGDSFLRVPLNQQGPNDIVPKAAGSGAGAATSTDRVGGPGVPKGETISTAMHSPVDWNCPPDVHQQDRPTGPISDGITFNGADNPNDTLDGFGTISLASQVFKEKLPVAGTDFSLHYASDRVPGYLANATLELPLTGDITPDGLLHTDFTVDVAGQSYSQTFDPSPNVVGNFQWNGRDVYHPQGAHFSSSALARITLAYRYPIRYAGKEVLAGQAAKLPPFFGLPGTMPSRIVHNDVEQAVLTKYDRILTIPDHRRVGLGGWSITPHHFYDPTAKVLYRGDGQQVRVDAKGQKMDRLYPGFPVPLDGRNNPIAVNANGETFFMYDAQIFKVTPGGNLRAVTNSRRNPTVGSTPISTQSHDLNGRLASAVSLDDNAHDLRAGPDGSIYLAFTFSIWKLDKDERFHEVLCGYDNSANGGPSQINVFAPDGASSHEAYCKAYTRIAVAKDGTVYFNDFFYSAKDGRPVFVIRKVAPDERIYTIAGLGEQPQPIDAYTSGDAYGDLDMGTPALTARFRQTRSLAVGPDDSLYYASGNFGLNRIKPNGILERVVAEAPRTDAGRPGTASDEGKPGVGAGAQDYGREGVIDFVNVAPDGDVYFWAAGAYTPRSLWRIGSNSVLQRVAGGYFGDLNPDHAPPPTATGNPLQLDIDYSTTGLALGPDGSLYLATASNGSTIRKISPALPGFNNGELTIASENGSEIYVFDQNGRHLRTVDPLVNYTKYTFNYDNHGYLSSVGDRDGLVTTIERNGSGNVTGVVGPYGTRTQLQVDGNGFLKQVTAPDNTQTVITNSDGGLLLSITGPRQDTFSFAYDSQGRLTQGNQPTGGFTALTRSGSTTDATIVASTAEGRTESRRVAQTSTGGNQLTRTFPDKTPEIDTARLDGSVFVDDSPISLEQVYRSSDPRPSLSGQATYPNLVSITIPNGPAAKITSSEQAVLSNPDDPASLTQFVRAVSLNGNSATNTYDVATRTSTMVSAEARTITLRLDERGRPVETKAGNLASGTLSYDGSGRLTTASAGSGANARVATLTYDANGFLSSLSDADGRETHFTNDLFGKPIATQMPGNRTVGFTYGVDGRLESVTPPGRQAYTFQYDPSTARTIFATPALLGVDNATVIEQTLDQRTKSITLPGGRRIDYSRANSGRLTAISDTFGDTFSYGYDAAGRLASVTRGGGDALTFSYSGVDVSGLTWSGQMSGAIIRQFNNDFRLASETVTGEAPVNFAYTPDGLASKAGEFTLTWRADVRLLASTQLGSIATSYQQNEFGEQLDKATTFSGAPLNDIHDTYDSGGRIQSETTSVSGGASSTTTYSYNAAGFLDSVTRNGTLTTSYTYDSNANLINAVTPSGSVSYSYDARDRLLSAGATSFTYTDAGEMRTRSDQSGTTSYNYDEFGQLRRVVLNDGRVIDYVLGAPGLRTVKKVNGARVQAFLRDHTGRIIAELDQANALVNRFVYVPGSSTPAYLVHGTSTFRLITDSAGSVRLVVNAQTGEIAQRLDYDEWGFVIADTQPGFQPFGFAGGIYDHDTGLVRYGARDYDPSIRRWTAPDPASFSGGGSNLYAYVDNNPVNFTDRQGLGPDRRGRLAAIHAEAADASIAEDYANIAGDNATAYTRSAAVLSASLAFYGAGAAVVAGVDATIAGELTVGKAAGLLYTGFNSLESGFANTVNAETGTTSTPTSIAAAVLPANVSPIVDVGVSIASFKAPAPQAVDALRNDVLTGVSALGAVNSATNPIP